MSLTILLHILTLCTCYTTLSPGNRAGLQTSKVSRAENDEMRQRRERELKDMDPSMLGKEADTVYSDKHGRRIYPKLEKVDKVNIFMSGEEGKANN